MRLIDAEKLKEQFRQMKGEESLASMFAEDMMKAVEAQPTAYDLENLKAIYCFLLGRIGIALEPDGSGRSDILDKKRQGEPAETKPVAGAAKALIRSMYMHGDVAEYVAGKYDIKGEIGIG